MANMSTTEIKWNHIFKKINPKDRRQKDSKEKKRNPEERMDGIKKKQIA